MTKIFPILIVLFFGLLLSVLNYLPNSWLSGWDTLHPEFNFPLNLSRIIFGVWRPEQGVGALAIHSHMSELPRLFFLMVSSLILPDSLIRYFFFFAMLVLGPLGVYFFIRSQFKGSYLPALMGGIFYLFNLGVVQHFYVPFEMFAVQYGLLPFVILFCSRYIKTSSKKDLLLVFLFSFISAPQAYAATLFYVFFGLLSIFVFLYSLPKIRVGVVTILVVLAANLFWLIPNTYSVLSKSGDVQNATINQLFSDEASLSNRASGNIPDFALHRNFLFSWLEYDFESGNFVPLLNEWKDHLANPIVGTIGIGIFFIVILGIFSSIYKRDRAGIAFIPIFLLCLFLWLNENPPFGFLYTFLRENIPILKEALRTPFTKISIPLLLVGAYYFAYFFRSIHAVTNRTRVVRILLPGTSALVVIGLLVFMLPAFKGNLVSPSMKTSMPGEYAETLDWLNSQPQGRIAKLPLHTPYGWVYHSWGYQGAGFTWFGSKNPQLDRDFDRWSPNNESFYNEARYALYSGTRDDFIRVMQKYDVTYLLLDESVINAGGSEDALYFEELKTILSSSDNFTLARNSNFLSVYKLNNTEPDYLSTPQEHLALSLTSAIYDKVDQIYKEYGNYTEGQGPTFPFANLDVREGVAFSLDEENITLTKEFEPNLDQDLINLSGHLSQGGKVYTSLKGSFVGDNVFQLRMTPIIPDLKVNGIALALPDAQSTVVDMVYLNHSGRPTRLALAGQIFDLPPVSQGEFDIGNVLLEGEGENSAKLYVDDTLPVSDEFTSRLLSSTPRSCVDVNKEYAFESYRDGFSLNTTNESTCLGSYFELDRSALFELSFNSISVDGVYPRVCLVEANQQGCRVDYIPSEYKVAGEANEYEFRYPLDANNYWIDFVAQAQMGDEEARVNYNNINLSLRQQVGEAGINLIPETSTELGVAINGPVSQISLTIPKINEIVEPLGLNRGTAEARNCAVGQVGKAGKEVQQTEGAITYSADDNGVACDYFEYLTIPSQGLILNIAGENTSGRGLKIYLNRSEGVVSELEQVLNTGKFDQSFVVYPKAEESAGYTLNLETRSFGSVESENRVSRISLAPLPIDWIKSISLGEPKKVNNTLSIISLAQINPVQYSVSTTGEGLLKLSQGFDNGWIAFSGSTGLLPHVKVNSWANGWLVPEGEYTITIFFWPQLLQWFGFVVLIVTPIAIWKLKR